MPEQIAQYYTSPSRLGSVACVGWANLRPFRSESESESPPLLEALRGGPSLSVPRSSMPKRKQEHKEEDEGDSESETVVRFVVVFFLKLSAETCPVESHPS